MMRARPQPVLENADGDLVVMTTDDFDLNATRDNVVARLVSMPGAQEPEKDGSDGEVVITKPGNAQHRAWDNNVVGRIVIMKQRLRIETNSLRRADTLRAAVERHCGDMVHFRLRQETSPGALMEAARSAPRKRLPSKPQVPSPEEMLAMRQFRERHMQSWLDDAIPALDGLTPRHAVTLSKMRPRVELLLKQFENSEARLPPDERIDIGTVRGALGLV